MHKFTGLLLSLFLLASPAYAIDDNKPEEIESVIKAENPLGAASYTKIWMNVYRASLWTDAPEWSMEKPFALSIKYHVDIEAKDVVARTLTEMGIVSDMEPEKVRSYGPQLTAIFPEIRKGDIITSLYNPSNGSATFFHNVKKIGIIKDPIFSEAFYGIWLSPKTSEPKMRMRLLGKTGGKLSGK